MFTFLHWARFRCAQMSIAHNQKEFHILWEQVPQNARQRICRLKCLNAVVHLDILGQPFQYLVQNHWSNFSEKSMLKYSM